MGLILVHLCQHVRSLVAIGGKADIGKAALNKGLASARRRKLSYPPADSLLRSGLVQDVFRGITVNA